MFRHRRKTRTRGQALVEFALAATLIFMLLAAAIDLGFIFFTLQELRTAAQEGATYGSHPVMVMAANGITVSAVDLPYNQIVHRVRSSAGDSPNRFANLYDLNNNGKDDEAQDPANSVIDTRNRYSRENSYIRIQLLSYAQDDLTRNPGTCATSTPLQGMRYAGEFCYVRVTVSYEYRFIFPLMPVFGDTIRLHASYMTHVRSSFIG